MAVPRIHHVQVAIPPEGEEQARQFYGALLGFEEVPKPVNLQRRGGSGSTPGTCNCISESTMPFTRQRRRMSRLRSLDWLTCVAGCWRPATRRPTMNR